MLDQGEAAPIIAFARYGKPHNSRPQLLLCHPERSAAESKDSPR